jgi:hypothetical protein
MATVQSELKHFYKKYFLKVATDLGINCLHLDMTNLIIFYFEKNGEKIPPKNHKKIRVISHFLKRSHQVAKFRTQKRKKV